MKNCESFKLIRLCKERSTWQHSWCHFKERSFYLIVVSFEDDFTPRGRWETEDTFFSKIVEIDKY